VSGFARNELLGSNHNIIRHPDVPEAVFEDLWRNLKQGKPWTAAVKTELNRAIFTGLKQIFALSLKMAKSVNFCQYDMRLIESV